MSQEQAFFVPKTLPDCVKLFASLIAIGVTLFHLYTGAFGIIQAYSMRTVHLMTLMILIFLYFPTSKENPEKTLYFDLLLAFVCIFIDGYLLFNAEMIVSREWYVTEMSHTEISLAIVTILLLLEATRRVTGPALPIVAVIFMLYALFGNSLPYPFTIRSPNLQVFLDHMFLTTQAIFGVPLGTSATFVFLFIYLAALLDFTGAGKFIIDISLGLVGRSTGGPAKVAVLSSCMFGSISGHSVANVYGTGTFTIPLMKRSGYSPTYAGAIEAAASTGGQLMPPIMGASAFIMAEILGISYLSICMAALIPGLLYFFALFAATHVHAKKMKIRPVTNEELPDLKTLLSG